MIVFISIFEYVKMVYQVLIFRQLAYFFLNIYRKETMLSPEEIKSKLVLKKVTQARLAEECGISRSQFSTIITKTQVVLPKLAKILGENPFEIKETKRTRKKN